MEKTYDDILREYLKEELERDYEIIEKYLKAAYEADERLQRMEDEITEEE